MKEEVYLLMIDDNELLDSAPIESYDGGLPFMNMTRICYRKLRVISKLEQLLKMSNMCGKYSKVTC